MPQIRSATDIAKKWARVTPQRSDDYKAGVESPRRDWAQATKKAEKAYAAGVQAAISEKRFGRGVDAAGTEKWQRNTLKKGVDRWGPGVQAARGDYEAGFAPFREVIASTQLPPRFAAGDPRNIERVRVLTQALRAAKTKKK